MRSRVARWTLRTILALSSTHSLSAELLVWPSQHGARGAALMQAFERGLKTRPVFDAGESQALNLLDEDRLARAVRVPDTEGTRARARGLGLLTESADAQARPQGAKKKPKPVPIVPPPQLPPPPTAEPKPVPVPSSEAYLGLQWGLKNSGASQRLLIDELTTYRLAGYPDEDTGALRAPEPTAPRKPVIVAVLDTGVDVTHPDLRDQIAWHPTECEMLQAYKDCLSKFPESQPADRAACDQKYARLDTDQNGYPLDCQGWNVVGGRNQLTGIMGNGETTDDAGHGTHVSGIIAAAVNNYGVRGVAPSARILPVKVIKSSPNAPIRPQDDGQPLPPLPSPIEKDLKWTGGFADQIARGMLYAMRSGAQVVNLSLAWPQAADSPFMGQMLDLAERRGVLVVAAAGNDSADSRVLPCAHSGVICVASHGPDGAFSHFSNYGAWVDVAAPGLAILSTWPLAKKAVVFTETTGFEYKNGTSMASPFVAGVLAELLARGIPPLEARARLFAGTRATQPTVDPQLRSTHLPEKTLRFGSVDLPLSLRAQPTPLFASADKKGATVLWSGKPGSFGLSVKLKNLWISAQDVRVRAELVQPADTRLSLDEIRSAARLEQDSFAFTAWESGGTQTLSLGLNVQKPERLEGRMQVELRVEFAGGAQPQVVRIPVEVWSQLGPSAEVQLPITQADGRPAKFAPTVEWRTFNSGEPRDGSDRVDYLAVEPAGQETRYTYVEEQDPGYRVRASRTMPAVQGDLLANLRIDVDRDGTSDVVLIYRTQPQKEGAKPGFRFVYLTKDLQDLPGRPAADFDNVKTVLAERHQWLSVPTQDGKRALAPAWIAFGVTPQLDRPAPSPWEPKPDEPQQLRFYYLGVEGLREVAAPKGAFFVQLLGATQEQQRAGAVPVLLARGSDYFQTYEIALVKGREVEVVAPVKFGTFRMMTGLSAVQEVITLGTQPITATAFGGSVGRGDYRVTVITNEATPRVFDLTARAGTLLDSVMGVTGVFLGPHGFSFFSQSHYEITLAQPSGSRWAGLNRFSFLPAFIFRSQFFATVVRNRPGSVDRDRPAVLAPDTSTKEDAVEVVLQPEGGEGLSRPASLRFIADPKCQLLGSPVPARGGEPAMLAAHCGDRFVRVPLQMVAF